MRALSIFALLITSCAPPLVLESGAQKVEVQGDHLVVTRPSGEVLMDLDLLATTFGRSRAGFEMAFGMFNIQEVEERAPRAPDALKIANDDGLVGELLVGERALATVRARLEADDHLVVEISASDDDNRGALFFDCAADDHFVGLGAHTHDVDFRGQRVPLWVSEQGIGKSDSNELPDVWPLLGRRHTTHIPVPAMVTSRGTAIVLESAAHSFFDLCATDESKVSLEAWERTLKVHVLVGDDPKDALKKLTAFVGRPALPAEWMHAPWNDAIFGEETVLEFANFLRDEEISSGAIWTEDWKGGNDQGDFYRLEGDWRLDREIYPNYEQMVQTLNDLGFQHQLYFNTFVTNNADVFDEVQDVVVKDDRERPYTFSGAEDGFRETVLIDLTSEAGLAFTKSELQTALDLGARGWMADYGEWMPVDFAVLANGGDPELEHNMYPVRWHQLNYELLEENGLLDEAIIFARSGHLFAQGFTQVAWAGDQRTSFQEDDGLPTVIPIGVGLSAAGYLFYAHDIAGYQSGTNDPADEELFFRWTSLGAFSPIMRTHHGTHARFNHNLRTNEATTAHWKRYANFHTRLYPYARSLAVRAVDEGLPMWLPMGLQDPSDDDVWGLLDQVWLGDALLVAPVMQQGALEREVLLPEGRFVRLMVDEESNPTLGEVFTQGAHTVAAGVSEIPVFVRAGGIVPTLANVPLTLMPNTDVEGLESTEGDRVVVVALGQSGAFIEASGASYTLEGDGTSAPEDAVELTGNGAFEGDGFRFVLEGHPSARTTRVLFR